MFWLTLILAIVCGIGVGLYTRNWKRAVIVGVVILIIGLIAAFGVTYMEWYVINNS